MRKDNPSEIQIKKNKTFSVEIRFSRVIEELRETHIFLIDLK